MRKAKTMGRPRKKNAIGLTMLDYQLAFGGWQIKKVWLWEIFCLNLTVEQAKHWFAQRAGNRQIRPKRTRKLGLQRVQGMMRDGTTKLAQKIAAKCLTAEARRWLVQAVPAAGSVPPGELLALQGSVDITGSDEEPLPNVGDITGGDLPRGGSLVGDEPLFVQTETDDDLPRHTEEPDEKRWVYDASEFED